MSLEWLELLVSLAGPLILKKSARMREPISQAEPSRLTLTLRFLGRGLAFSFRLGRTTVPHMLGQICSTIYGTPDDGKQFQWTLRNFGIYYTASELYDGKQVNMHAQTTVDSRSITARDFFFLSCIYGSM